jgi:HAE1 family hydrophobic/amphiphilic exporter-1
MNTDFSVRTGTRRLALALALLVALMAPVQALASAQDEEPATVSLSLERAVRLAFDKNLDIAVIDYNRGIARENVVAAQGQFDMVLAIGTPGARALIGASGGGFGGGGLGVGGLGFTGSETPTAIDLFGVDAIVSDDYNMQFNVGQQMTSGFRFDLAYIAGRNKTNSVLSSLNPSWTNDLGMAITMPILQGRGEEATARQLLLARQNVSVTEEAFRGQVETILLQVEQAYWELVFAEETLSVQQQSLQLAEEQLERTQAQVEVGMVAPVQETQARAAVAQRESDLIVARNAVEAAADQLKALLRAEALPNGWDTRIETTDEPEVILEEVDLNEALRMAMTRRPELAQAQAQIAARRVETDAARSDLLPRLDVVASLTFNGIGGDLLVRDDFFSPPVGVIPGGYGDAIAQLFTFDYPTWRVGFNFAMPIGNRTAKGNYARATLAEDQAKQEFERTRQQAILEVRTEARNVEAAAELIEATRLARELAEEQLQIEQDRFEVGMSTNFEVLQFQDQLVRAAMSEVRAMIDYRVVLARLARAVGVLPDRYGITIQ